MLSQRAAKGARTRRYLLLREEVWSGNILKARTKKGGGGGKKGGNERRKELSEKQRKNKDSCLR
jgi:hypothetical protein